MKESFPHFTLWELTEKKELKSNEGYCIWNNSESVGYIFDCFYYHKAQGAPVWIVLFHQNLVVLKVQEPGAYNSKFLILLKNASEFSCP